MIFAMDENTALREKIFSEAVVSTACADAGVQFFNAMGVEVLVHEAYGLINTDLVEAELVALARGKSGSMNWLPSPETGGGTVESGGKLSSRGGRRCYRHHR